MRTCSFRLACFFMQSSAREALQVVAERFVAERCLENCDLKNFVGVIKMLYEVTRSAKWNDLLRQAIWESTVREVLQIISQTCLYERWLVGSDLKQFVQMNKDLYTHTRARYIELVWEAIRQEAGEQAQTDGSISL